MCRGVGKYHDCLIVEARVGQSLSEALLETCRAGISKHEAIITPRPTQAAGTWLKAPGRRVKRRASVAEDHQGEDKK